MPYFVGNVLPSSDAPGENDHTFDFTREESCGMDLSNVPIRLEHEEGLAVGHVKRDWTDDDGKKWCLRWISDFSSFEYVKNADYVSKPCRHYRFGLQGKYKGSNPWVPRLHN